MIWPAIRGSPFSFTGFIKRSQKKAFELYGARYKKVVDKWQKRRAIWGLEPGKMQRFDEFIQEWSTEEPGRVKLIAGDEDADTLRGELPEIPVEMHDGRANMPYAPACMCKTECTADTWTDED